MAQPLPVSVIILTRNESLNLPFLLDSIGWCDDIHVVDSGSTDGTVELATARGAHVCSHPFSGFGTQRNWALDHCPTRHDWILFLDADETTPPAFLEALARAVDGAPSNVAGYYCCWKMIIEDCWLKRCDHFPKWQFRLLRRGRARFVDYGHGQKEDAVQGDILYLRVPYEHHVLRKGWTEWLDRHNRYASREAVERLAASTGGWRDLFAPAGPERNRSLKTWVSRVPGWPLARFLLTYIGHLGFLEGRTGFVYCMNLAYYEFLIQIKMAELRRHPRTAPEGVTGKRSAD